MLIPESFFEDWNIFQIIGQLDVKQPHHTQSSGDPKRGHTSLPSIQEFCPLILVQQSARNSRRFISSLHFVEIYSNRHHTTPIPVPGKKSLPSIKFERIPFSFEQIYMPYKYKSIHKLIVVSMVTKVDVCCHDFPILNLCLPVPTPPRR